VATIIAPLVSYFALKKIEALRLVALDELNARKIAEEKLQISYSELETKVKERTSELSKSNRQLQEEIVLRKLAEDEIRKHAEQILVNKESLEIKALELTQLNDQLHQSEKKLKESNIGKDKFFSILAHDLRSPFHSIKGLSEILLEDHQFLSKEEIKELSEGIFSSSNKILKLLDNLLDWSRVQTGRIELKSELISIEDIVKQNISLFADIAKSKEITIECKNQSACDPIADKNMIDTVIRNLLSNSIKFTRKAGNICVSFSEVESEVIVSVEDNGVGIPEENVHKLFKVEENYSTYGTDNERGTGLGLVLCAEFIHLNKGRIWVESKINEGSKFSFSLPKQY
jgi:signal transduction histidine kinase